VSTTGSTRDGKAGSAPEVEVRLRRILVLAPGTLDQGRAPQQAGEYQNGGPKVAPSLPGGKPGMVRKESLMRLIEKTCARRCAKASRRHWLRGTLGLRCNRHGAQPGARLCGEARLDQILLSQSLAAAVDQLASFEALRPLTLKGFRAPHAGVQRARAYEIDPAQGCSRFSSRSAWASIRRATWNRCAAYFAIIDLQIVAG